MIRQSELSVIWVLVRRDYALQYAGSFLGISWMLLQNMTLILLYAFVFLFMNWKNMGSQENYTGYVFSGLLFWIPLQELLLRGTSILTDNRQLIKRSSLGIDVFLWIPYVQFMIHYLVTAIPVGLILYFYSSLSLDGFVLSVFWMGLVGFYVLMLLNYLARLNIILKDISPLIHLITQVLFWTIPILYYPVGFLGEINKYHPFNIPLDIFRRFILEGYNSEFSIVYFLPFVVLFLIIYIFSRKRFHKVVLDHL